MGTVGFVGSRQHGQRAGRRTSWATGHTVVGARRGRPAARARWRHARRHRSPTSRSAPPSSCAACPTVPRRSGRARSSVAADDRVTTHVVDTSTVGVAPLATVDDAAGRTRRRLRRRAGVGRRRRRARPHARGDVRRRRRRVRARRAGARRPQRPSPPGRRPARHGAGDEAREQLPLRHHARRHQRGDRLRRGGGPRHGHHARRAQRRERPERRHERQVPATTCSPVATPPGSPTR